MTTEQKFKQLLNIACNNGFNNLLGSVLPKNCLFTVTTYKDMFDVTIETDNIFESIGYFSLNDLVLETNFFECLFKDFKGSCLSSVYYELYKGFDTIVDVRNTNITLIQSLKFHWVLEVEKGTALEWLFKQFDL